MTVSYDVSESGSLRGTFFGRETLTFVCEHIVL